LRGGLLWLAPVGFLAAAFLGLIPSTARAALTMDWYTMDGGGGTFSTGGVLSLGGTVGQPDAGSCAGGTLVLDGGFWHGGAVPSDVEDPGLDGRVPDAFRLVAGFPNPFRGATAVLLDLPEGRDVFASIYDPAGRLVRLLQDGPMPAGYHRFVWDGRDGRGRRVASGVYLLRVRAGTEEVRRRVVLLR
jgi:hypothetical protein